MARRLFTSESVTEGHPDKICDQISDAVLDDLLKNDPNSRVACECAVTTGLCLVMGEVTTKAYSDIAGIARRVIADIGFNDPALGFDGASCAVLTTLDRTMMPILRYRTRDLTRILTGECPCGRTHRRIDRIKGRTDDMFIIKGVNVFPMQVEKILAQYPGLGSNYLITLDTVDDNDVMTVEVELDDMPSDVFPELQKMTRNIQRALKDEILLTPKVKLVKKGSIPTGDGKAVRVKDLRDGRK